MSDTAHQRGCVLTLLASVVLWVCTILTFTWSPYFLVGIPVTLVAWTLALR